VAQQSLWSAFHQHDEDDAQQNDPQRAHVVEQEGDERHRVEREEPGEAAGDGVRCVGELDEVLDGVFQVQRPPEQHADKQRSPQDAPGVRARTAQDERDPHEEGQPWPEHRRVHRVAQLEEDVQRAGQSHQGTAQHERLHLEAAGVFPERAGDVLVFADRLEDATERRPAGPLEEPVEPDDDDHEHEGVEQRLDVGSESPADLEGRIDELHYPLEPAGVVDVGVKGRRVPADEPGPAARPQQYAPEFALLEGVGLVEIPHDLRHRDRRDSQVVRAQPQRREADDEAQQRRGDDCPDESDDERQAEPARAPCCRLCHRHRHHQERVPADGHEPDDADVEQPRVSPVEVQRECQHRVDRDEQRQLGDRREDTARTQPRDDPDQHVGEIERGESPDDQRDVGVPKPVEGVGLGGLTAAHAVDLPANSPLGRTSRMTIISANADARAKSVGIQICDSSSVNPMMTPPKIAP